MKTHFSNMFQWNKDGDQMVFCFVFLQQKYGGKLKKKSHKQAQINLQISSTKPSNLYLKKNYIFIYKVSSDQK